VITARERIVRFVEDVLGLWLTDLYGKMGGLLKTAILEHQGLTDVRAPSPSGSTSGIFGLMTPSQPSGGLFSSIWSSTPVEEKPDLDTVLSRTQEIVNAMLVSGLSPALTTRIIECLLQHVSIGCFNQIMLRKSYATWKRGIQIQYNLTRLEEFLSSMSIPTATAFSYFDPVMQVSNLLQMAKALEDLDSIKEACPALSLLQIRRVLTSYQADRYDDGPVNPDILQMLDQEIESEQGEVPQGDAGVLLEASGVHFDIAAPPKAPVPANSLPSTLPANLYKFFILTQDTL
jgi:myosin-5